MSSSPSPKVKYSPLATFDAASEEDEEDEGFADNVLYDSRLVVGPSMDHRRDVFELERLGQPRSPPRVAYSKRVRVYQAVGVISILVLLVLVAVLVPVLNHMSSPGQVVAGVQGLEGRGWSRVYNNSLTESNLRLVDVDGDGVLDVVFGLADQKVMVAFSERPEGQNVRDYCIGSGAQYPCVGKFVAVHGQDGHELWSAPTRSVVLHHVCRGGLDADGDGQEDCLLTGRHGTCQAVDLRTGKLLWVADPDLPQWSSHMVAGWSVFQALVVSDLDGDGTRDLVVAHGGDQSKEPSDKDRQPGRLIILSGRSGRPIGSTFLQLPSNQETYMPPVKYVADTGAVYILFGSGGETLSGALFSISLPDLYRAVTGHLLPGVDLRLYTWLSDADVDEKGIAVLMGDNQKGVMVPPVLADVNNDGSTDILVTSFSGSVALIDGSTRQVIWSRHFPGMESYSSPSPGFFNDDSTLDFLLHFNEGEWDNYNGSRTVVLSGIDGDVLWGFEAGTYSYSSDLSLKTKINHMDAFLINVVGRNTKGKRFSSNTDFKKRHLSSSGQSDSEKGFRTNFTADEFNIMCYKVGREMRLIRPQCDQDLSYLTQEVLLLDGETTATPLVVKEQKAELHRYELTHNPGDRHCHPLVDAQHKIRMCAVMEPMSFTGAVGDLDGDGTLSYVHITQMTGFQHSDTYDITGSVSNVVIGRSSLDYALANGDIVTLSQLEGQGYLSTADMLMNPNDYFESLEFLPCSSQSWSEYLGAKGDSQYHQAE